jgi:hypothetical protein
MIVKVWSVRTLTRFDVAKVVRSVNFAIAKVHRRTAVQKVGCDGVERASWSSRIIYAAHLATSRDR